MEQIFLTPFQQALDIIERLSADGQEALIEIIRRRGSDCVSRHWLSR